MRPRARKMAVCWLLTTCERNSALFLTNCTGCSRIGFAFVCSGSGPSASDTGPRLNIKWSCLQVVKSWWKVQLGTVWRYEHPLWHWLAYPHRPASVFRIALWVKQFWWESFHPLAVGGAFSARSVDGPAFGWRWLVVLCLGFTALLCFV